MDRKTNKASDVNPKVSADSASTDSTKGWLLVSPRIFIGLVGVISCYVWLFFMLGTSVVIVGIEETPEFFGLGHLLFVVGILLSLLLTWIASDILSSHRYTQFVAALLFSMIGMIGLYYPEVFTGSVWVFSLLTGCGFGLLYPLAGEYVCIFFHGAVRPYINGIFLTAAILCAGIFFAGKEMDFFFVSLFPLCAFISYSISMYVFRFKDLARVKGVDSDSRNKVSWRSYLATVTSGMATGYGAGCLLSTCSSQPLSYVAVEIMSVVICLVMLTDSLKSHKLTETITMRFFLSGSAVLVFPLIFVPDQVKVFFAAFLLCSSLFPTTCSLSAMCKHIIICDLSAIRAFSLGRIMSFVGILFGMALAFVGFSPFFVGISGGIAASASVVFFMILVILSASFVMTEDNYPDEKRLKVDHSSQGEIVSVSPGMPIRKLNASILEESEGSADEVLFDRPGLFQRKCDLVATQYGLSARQKEVLTMLAKGRNAEYITEKLVISTHTAKAHIYNIYQKTGVHSRQELMDLVEEAQVEHIE